MTLLADGREELIDDLVLPSGRPVLGWKRKPHGWCRGDACVPAFRSAAAELPPAPGTAEPRIDLVAFAQMLGRQVVVDPEEGVVAVGEPAQLSVDKAPGFTLGDDFTLSDRRGTKVALVFWASWCGCRYDLAVWDDLHRELREYGFGVVSVSLDRRAEDAEPWTKDLAHTALVDTEGRVAELYDVINVPTVVWIDEDGRIARPQDTMTATDTFRSMNGLSSEAATAALRRWVRTGESGLSGHAVREHLRTPTDDERLARLHGRIAAWLFRRGRTAAAGRHLAKAAELAPHDLSIRRGLMPLAGVDPFGDEYFRLREELERAGVMIYRPLPDWHIAG
ncbi:TlpA family protein disulfide reductase [Spongiactinospora gelatinilytica]|uniref:TlpA family protein disulfide reductase n=1 Tax=Spongiactinospora gelatinilytica TaxID=2666298 RepID=A0A2W2FV04_9ACTN|nr:TlpA family protein disulfide reductase [Spongiactinospora gelatinilytica]